MKKVLLLIGLFAMVAVQAQSLVLATYQYATNNRLANIQPLATHLSKELGVPVSVKSYPTVHAFIDGIRNNEVDIALINTFGYLLLESAATSYAMQPSVVLKVKDGAQDNYKTAIVTPTGFPVDTLTRISTIAGKTKLMLVAVGSTSGNLVPRLALSAVGVKDPEKEFAAVVYGGNHTSTMDSVLTSANPNMVAAMGSTEYIALLKDPVKAAKVKLLWYSPEIPLGPVLLHNRLSAATKANINRLLLALHNTEPATLESVKNGWSEAKQAEYYIPLKAGYYESFTRQLGDQPTMQKILKQFAN
jgi:phosphate/phosphite/phosphonate ABC transporter binding protein